MDLNEIYQGDSLELIKKIETESIHLILSDIPYGINYEEWDVLHNNKNSALGKENSKKTGFKTRGKPLNGWSEADKKIPEEYQQWVEKWAKDWLRALKPGASCFVFAGRRMSHRVIVAFENQGFVFKDMLAWKRGKAVLKAQRLSKVYERRKDFENAKNYEDWRIGNLRPTFEPILWFMKPYKQGSTITDNMLKNGVGAFNLDKWGKYVPNKDNIIEITNETSDRGLHPTQKPLLLMEALIELTTQEKQIVLDPFSGSGTTLLAAKKLNRNYIGFEQNEKYYKNAIKRIKESTQ